MYHRVVDIRAAADPWKLAVSPQNFHDHIQWLSSHCEILPLEDLLDFTGQKPAVALTFDDGYADNLYHALPVLEKFKAPATIFISTAFTDNATMFWWDDLARIFLTPSSLPESLSLEGDKKYYINLGEDAHITEKTLSEFASDWMPWDKPPTNRHKAYYEIWHMLRKAPTPALREYMNQLYAWAGVQRNGKQDDLPMTRDQLVAIDKSHHVTLGAHTQNHYSLKNLSAEDQAIEIIGGLKILEALLDRQITTFSYPFGDYDSDSLQLVKTAKFKLACTTVQSTMSLKNNPYLVPRLEINNWTKNVFETMMLKNLSNSGSIT